MAVTVQSQVMQMTAAIVICLAMRHALAYYWCVTWDKPIRVAMIMCLGIFQVDCYVCCNLMEMAQKLLYQQVAPARRLLTVMALQDHCKFSGDK